MTSQIPWPTDAYLVVAVTPAGQARRKVYLSRGRAAECEARWRHLGFTVNRAVAQLHVGVDGR